MICTFEIIKCCVVYVRVCKWFWFEIMNYTSISRCLYHIVEKSQLVFVLEKVNVKKCGNGNLLTYYYCWDTLHIMCKWLWQDSLFFFLLFKISYCKEWKIMINVTWLVSYSFFFLYFNFPVNLLCRNMLIL